MPFLDELEGVDCDPPDYKRIQTQLYPKNSDSSAVGQQDGSPLMTWAYVFQDKARCRASTSSATLLPDGVWLPREHGNGSLKRVEREAQSLLVIKNQPLLDMDKTVGAVRAFLHAHLELGAEELQPEAEAEQRVVAQFPPWLLPAHTQPNEVGVVVPPHACSALQLALEQQQQPSAGLPTVSASALQAGSYAQYTYRGPYYGLEQAWRDFGAAICAAGSTFEAVEGAECFQIFRNYGENTPTPDLRTDLYRRVK